MRCKLSAGKPAVRCRACGFFFGRDSSHCTKSLQIDGPGNAPGAGNGSTQGQTYLPAQASGKLPPIHRESPDVFHSPLTWGGRGAILFNAHHTFGAFPVGAVGFPSWFRAATLVIAPPRPFQRIPLRRHAKPQNRRISRASPARLSAKQAQSRPICADMQAICYARAIWRNTGAIGDR
jgi:hypothetical protein